MKYTTFYSSVEKVVYEFDDVDVRMILIQYLKEKQDGSWNIEMCDDYKRKDDDIPSGWHIELTHVISKPVETLEVKEK